MNAPTIDKEFIIKHLTNNPNILAAGINGNSAWYIKRGKQPIGHRLVIIRNTGDGQIPYEVAAGIAFRFKFMDEFLKWLEENRSWKDGGYTTTGKKD
jgi:hypothetical protein